MWGGVRCKRVDSVCGMRSVRRARESQQGLHAVRGGRTPQPCALIHKKTSANCCCMSPLGKAHCAAGQGTPSLPGTHTYTFK